MNRGSAGKLIPDKIENIGAHYVKVLRVWRESFLNNFSSAIRPEMLETNPMMNKTKIENFKRKWQVIALFSRSPLTIPGVDFFSSDALLL